MYEEKAKAKKIRNKWNWYGHGEKSTKFFLNWKNHRAIQSQIHSVIINQDEITDQTKINKQIFSLINLCFRVNFRCKQIKKEAYLANIPLPKIANEQTLSYEGNISEYELFKSLKSMENNKSPGDYGLSKLIL